MIKSGLTKRRLTVVSCPSYEVARVSNAVKTNWSTLSRSSNFGQAGSPTILQIIKLNHTFPVHRQHLPLISWLLDIGLCRLSALVRRLDRRVSYRRSRHVWTFQELYPWEKVNLWQSTSWRRSSFFISINIELLPFVTRRIIKCSSSNTWCIENRNRHFSFVYNVYPVTVVWMKIWRMKVSPSEEGKYHLHFKHIYRIM